MNVSFAFVSRLRRERLVNPTKICATLIETAKLNGVDPQAWLT
ncbi:transposase domain-containing protein [uncultured Pelagimonas sp.]|nr:transposase domain-containing protein [uncultured Pelagimonas sp.]